VGSGLYSGQLLAAFLAAALQEGAAIRSGHALAESAFAGAFQFRRLVGTFHFKFSYVF